jgi:hypothetical protein
VYRPDDKGKTKIKKDLTPYFWENLELVFDELKFDERKRSAQNHFGVAQNHLD